MQQLQFESINLGLSPFAKTNKTRLVNELNNNSVERKYGIENFKGQGTWQKRRITRKIDWNEIKVL